MPLAAAAGCDWVVARKKSGKIKSHACCVCVCVARSLIIRIRAIKIEAFSSFESEESKIGFASRAFSALVFL